VLAEVGQLGLRYPLGVGAAAVAYYGAAHLSFAFNFAGPVAAIIWLPVGVGIAFLYLGGLRLWPGVAIGDVLVNNYSALPLGSALGQSFGNLLEVVVACVLIRRLGRGRAPFAGVGSLAGGLVAIAVGTAVSATVGAVSLRLGHVITTAAAPQVWRTWWLGDASGALVVVPLALAWWRVPRRVPDVRRAVEAALLLAAVAALSELSLHTERPLTYLVFPGLIWAALRFGERGATAAVAIVAGFAVLATTHYVGPFADHSLARSILNTQLFIAVAAISTLCLAAVVAEREELAERLRASRGRMVEAGDTERRRLERNLHDGAQQRLTALMVRLGISEELAGQDPDLAVRVICAARAELSLAIEELRELAHGIHPTALTRLGLAKAIESIGERSAVPIELAELPSARVDPAAEATAYYVVAEAVANGQKHARASTIRIRAAVADRALQIEVVDDGVGGATETAGLGLQGLRDRVEATGGSFELESAPGRGTRIAALIPIPAAPA
jgi:signal transduction histidine kinase